VSTATKIEWTRGDDGSAGATWNPVTGCTKVSEGCDHCYAETFAERWRGVKGHPFEQGFDIRLWPERLDLPLRWRKPRRIFLNSMSDFSVGVKCPVPAFPQARTYPLPPWRLRHVARTREGGHFGGPGNGARRAPRSTASRPEYECDARSGRNDQDAELAGSLPASKGFPAHLGQFDDQPIQPAHGFSSSTDCELRRAVRRSNGCTSVTCSGSGYEVDGVFWTQRRVEQVLKNQPVAIGVGLAFDTKSAYQSFHIHHLRRGASSRPDLALSAGSVG
jgi:hypothetical protein